MAVDVVVVNYHTPDLLNDFVKSYWQHRFANCTLTVVDVEVPIGSPNNLDLKGADRYVQFAGNVGYARACNDGAQYGTNDVILLANADTQLSEGLMECHNALLDNQDWGILGPRQVDEYNRIKAGGIFGTDRSIGQRGWDEIDHGQYSDVREDAKSVSGSLYFVKRKVWEELTECPYMREFEPSSVGAFIHTPHYYEETACSYHARAHGYKIVFYGPVQMLHHWHAASEHGGWADRQVEVSKAHMRAFCSYHSIVCE